MMVLTAPSNILIFWGLCFFLYSRISCQKQKVERREQIKKSPKEEKKTKRERGGLKVLVEKMIKCIQVAWSEGGILARKPYLTAAYHSQLLPFQLQQ